MKTGAGLDLAAATGRARQGGTEPLRVLRIISRLNVGGPAIQAITLTERLPTYGYETRLIRGMESADEGSMDALARQLGVEPLHIGALRREIGAADLIALLAILAIMLRFRPDIVHTHAAKAGMLGRLAAIVARVPVTVHTFHGHVLEGYFSPRRAQLFQRLEHQLARHTTRLVTVSEEVRSDLVRLGIAPEREIEVIPLGFDLDRFDLDRPARESRRRDFRERYEIAPGATVVALVARLAPIKRVDRFLRVARRIADDPGGGGVHFVVAGDGALRDQVHALARDLDLGARVTWTGFGADICDVYAGSDVVALTSDNEGTPVSLIEAHACSLPVVATDVGGVRAVVRDGGSGYVAGAARERELGERLLELAADPALRSRFGAAGRDHVRSRFTLERLVADIDSLYRRLAAEAGIRPAGG